MPRIQPLTPELAQGHAKDLLNDVKKKIGMVPNLMRTMAQSPAVLQAYLQFNDALASGELPRKHRELIAVSVGQSNECNYCVSAHSAIGKSIGLTAEELMDARLGHGFDRQSDALIRFARSVV
ncbi:MAG: carboxymuconolactone decarboxylase family protein, partial [Candidatus Omnitrophica bacterium]|nr:carboxymuconolactone decarboxylase family protein [Candidatus Omnitrophota bacterium]